MRIIKLALISFITFFGLLTAFSLLIPSQVRISKAINIGAPQQKILSLVADTAKWKQWHPFFLSSQNPDMQRVKIRPVSSTDSLVVMQWTSTGKNPLTNGWQVYKYSRTDSLTLQWYIDFDLGWYPWQKFGSLFYEATYGTMMQQGLERLRLVAQEPATE